MPSEPNTTATKEEAKPALVPKLRFPEFREMQAWNIEAVGDLVAESRMPSLLNDPTKRITVRLHLQGVEHREHRGTESTESTNNFCRKAGQFIYGKQNIHKGAFGIIPDQLDGFETSQDLPCFDFKRRCCPQWFYFNFASEAVYGPLELKMTGTGSKRLNEKTFLGLPIAVPSHSEQQKIAECLSSVDEVIAAQARKLDALKTHKKGLMQQLFPREGETQPRLRFPEFQNAGEWEPDTLENLCSAKISYGIVQAGPHVPNGMPYIKSTDLNSELCLASLARTSEAIAQKYRRSEVVPGDIVFSLRGNIGVAQILPKGIPVANLTQGTARIRTKNPSEFFFHALRSPSVHDQILAFGKGSTFQEISLGALRNVRLFHPKPPEQHRIATCLSSLDALIAAETQKHAALQRHKRGLMQQLFPAPEDGAA